MTDARHALRMARKTPAFTATAVLTLALGIGAVTSIFSLANGVLLRPLPFERPDCLVFVWEGIPRLDYPTFPFSPPDFALYGKLNRTLEGTGAYGNERTELSGVSQPERLVSARLTANLLPLLGVRPALGRAFTEEEAKTGRPVALVSHALWRRAFAADPRILGRSILLNRTPYEIVGVMPAGLEFPPRGPQFNADPADVFLPKTFTADELQQYGQGFKFNVIGRLKPGVTVEQAQAEAVTLVPRLEEAYPAEALSDPRFRLALSVAGARKEIVGPVQPLILVLFGAVALLLLVGCANVANLLLARASSRQREFALRAAVGAGRTRLVGQLLTESVMLGLAGGGLGVLLALWGTDLLVAALPVSIPRVESVRVDVSVLGFAVALSILTAVIFGLAPALRLARDSRCDTLREGARGTTPGRGHSRLLAGLVTVQFALALVLAVGGGLLGRSLIRLLATDPGFEPGQVMTFATQLPASTYSRAQQIRAFYEHLVDEVNGLPGVKVAGGGTAMPMTSTEVRMFSVEHPVGGAQQASASTSLVCVQGDYFGALRIPVRAGRAFSRLEMTAASMPVVMVSESLARRAFPGRNPVGERIKWGGVQSQAPWMTIVGVAGDVKQADLDAPMTPAVYAPFAQVSDPVIEGFYRFMDLAVRVDGVEPLSVVAAVRRKVRELDPALPMANVRTLEQVVADTVKPERFYTLLMNAFAGSALLLAAVGLFGVLATSVAQRRQEIGVRIALGARSVQVLGLVLRQGLLYAGLGLGLGLVASLAAARLLGGFLYGVTPSDPVTFVGVGVVLGLVALVASYLPARRATRVDPVVALRAE